MVRHTMTDKKSTVAITGMNARPDNPGPGLAVARCLRESTEFTGRIIGLGYDALDPGLYLKDYCDSTYLLPYPSTGDDALISRLREIQEFEKIDVLIPCLDAELPGMVRLVPLLNDMGIKTFIPTAEQLQLRNKHRLTEIANIAGIDSPETTSITHSGFFLDCQSKGWSYPLVVKGLFYDASVVNSPEEGIEAFKKIASEWGFPVLVQRLIKGQEYNLTAVGDGKGNMLGAIMMKKMAITDKGKAWAGVSIFDQKLHDASAAIIKTLKWQGPLEVEIMRDQQGKYHLIEINPRFPAWIYLSIGVQTSVVSSLVDLALGKTPGNLASPATGILFIRHAVEHTIPISEFEAIVTNGRNCLNK